MYLPRSSERDAIFLEQYSGENYTKVFCTKWYVYWLDFLLNFDWAMIITKGVIVVNRMRVFSHCSHETVWLNTKARMNFESRGPWRFHFLNISIIAKKDDIANRNFMFIRKIVAILWNNAILKSGEHQEHYL